MGKTTYARRFLRTTAETERFVNLHEIARGLSPLTPTPDAETATAAARIALSRISAGFSGGESFAVETTLAGRTHLGTIARARESGFGVRIVFAMLPTVELCIRRIADRVAGGGHAVTEDDARRRFARASANFARYAALADRWLVIDTQKQEPRLIAAGGAGEAGIADQMLFDALPAPLRAGLASLGAG